MDDRVRRDRRGPRAAWRRRRSGRAWRATARRPRRRGARTRARGSSRRTREPPVSRILIAAPPPPRRPPPAGPRAASARRRGRSRAARARRPRRPASASPSSTAAHERVPLAHVARHVALEEEVRQRRRARALGACARRRCARAGSRTRPCPRDPNDLDALVVAVDRLARVVDRGQAAARVHERDQRRVDVAGLGERRVDRAPRRARTPRRPRSRSRSAPCRSRGSSCRGRSRPDTAHVRQRRRRGVAAGDPHECGSPTAPPATASRTDWCAGSKRRLKPIWNGTPASSTAASARSTSARSSETGFSQKIALPAARPRRRAGRRACRCSSRSRPRRRRRRAAPSTPTTGTPSAAATAARPSAPCGVGHAGQLGAGDAPRQQLGVQAADPADADHADPHRSGAPAARRRPPSGPTAAERSSAAWTDTQASASSKPGANGAPLGDRAQNSASSIVTRSSKPIPFALPGTNAPCGGKRSPPSTVRVAGAAVVGRAVERAAR